MVAVQAPVVVIVTGFESSGIFLPIPRRELCSWIVFQDGETAKFCGGSNLDAF